MNNKTLIFASSIFFVLLLNSNLIAQNSYFFASEQYLKYLKYNNSDYLLFGPCLGVKIVVYADRIRAREYTAVTKNGYINSDVYKDYTYYYHEKTNKYRLKCTKSESSGLLGHEHTNGGHHYVKFDEFGDFLIMKTCGIARAEYKFKPYDSSQFLR